MALTQDELIKRLLQARKIGETPDWAIIGKDPDNAGNPFQAQADTGETNVVYATVKGNPDPQIIYYDPSADLRLLQYGARVEIEWRNGKAWLKGADKEFLTEQQAGTPLPTGNVPLPEHDHTSTTEGGTLGADTVDTTQLVDGGVTSAKLGTNAVTTDKIADANVTLAKMASNSVDTSQIVDDAVTNAKIDAGAVDTTELADSAVETVKIADDAVIPTKTDGLSGASVAFVTQTASDTFSSIDYTLTSNRRLLYDGSEVRQSYTLAQNTGGNQTTSGTTALVIATSSDLAGLVDTSNALLKLTYSFVYRGSVAGDQFELAFEYNYDNAGSEAWAIVPTDSGANSPWIEYINTTNYLHPMTLVTFTNVSALSPAWGYSGTFLIRFYVQRTSGTGAFSVFSNSGRPRPFIIEEM